MTQAIQPLPRPERAIIEYSNAEKELLANNIAKGLTEAEFDLFLHVVKHTGLDPFSKQIYAVPRGQGPGRTVTFQTGIDGYRLIAERTGQYEGQAPPAWCGVDAVWRDVWLSESPPSAAKAGVWRLGAREPVVAIATYREYVQKGKDGKPTDFWSRMPAAQLYKCAEAAALRKAFPQELSGIYTSEEMAQADNPPVRRPAAAEKPRLRGELVEKDGSKWFVLNCPEHRRHAAVEWGGRPPQAIKCTGQVKGQKGVYCNFSIPYEKAMADIAPDVLGVDENGEIIEGGATIVLDEAEEPAQANPPPEWMMELGERMRSIGLARDTDLANLLGEEPGRAALERWAESFAFTHPGLDPVRGALVGMLDKKLPPDLATKALSQLFANDPIPPDDGWWYVYRAAPADEVEGSADDAG